MTSDETTAAEIIVAITASPSEESIICGTDSKQLYTGALSVADIQRSGDQIRLVLIDKIAYWNPKLSTFAWSFSKIGYTTQVLVSMIKPVKVPLIIWLVDFILEPLQVFLVLSENHWLLLHQMIELFVYGTIAPIQLNSGRISLKKFILFLFIQLDISCLQGSVTSFDCWIFSLMISEWSESSRSVAVERFHFPMVAISSLLFMEILSKPFPQLLLSPSGRFSNWCFQYGAVSQSNWR